MGTQQVTDKYDYITIEEKSHGATYSNESGFTIYGHKPYERSSVLAGHMARCYLGHFDTLTEAQAAYPKAEVSGSSYQPLNLSVPPAWCTPQYEAETGEVWDDGE